MSLLSLVPIVLSLLPLNTWQPQAQVPARSQSNPSARAKLDHRIPAADPNKYKGIRDGNDWQNPYLVIHPNGVEIISKSSLIERRIILTDQLASALTRLPLTAWPYGRVIAVSNIGIRNGFFGSPVYQKDEQLIARNRTEIEKILKSLKVKVDWWPSN